MPLDRQKEREKVDRFDFADIQIHYEFIQLTTRVVHVKYKKETKLFLLHWERIRGLFNHSNIITSFKIVNVDHSTTSLLPVRSNYEGLFLRRRHPQVRHIRQLHIRCRHPAFDEDYYFYYESKFTDRLQRLP